MNAFKTFKTAGLVIGLCAGCSNQVDARSPVPIDKTAHFGISATATAACSILSHLMFKNKWAVSGICFATVNSAGVIKEITDPYHGGDRDEKDVYANLLGSSFSVFAISIGF